MYPKAHFVTIFAKPAGRPLVDDYVVDIPQNTGSNSRGIWASYSSRQSPVANLFNARHCRALFFNFRRVTIVSSKYSGGCIYDTGKPERNPVQTRFKHPETSTLVRRFSHGAQLPVQSALDGKTIPHWYRMINRLMWIWRGIDPVKSSKSRRVL